MSTEPGIPILSDRSLVLGVTGSIAAFKAADLASKLTQAGANVDTLLTRSAERFVSALSFQSLTGRRAYVEGDLWSEEAHILHVGLAQKADLVIVAPATADTIAKLAHGRADNLLCITALAAQCPIIVAPAMDGGMYQNPATQANIELLRERGVTIAGPIEGRMASGLVGTGRMIEPQDLLGHVRQVLGRSGPLQGRLVVVTAGGTQEPLDPVRVLANRSSGKQGYALAQAALDRGAEVTLISAPTALRAPIGAELIGVGSAAEMSDAVRQAIADADVLIMAAAVADFRPAGSRQNKIKKADGIPAVQLETTEDILAQVASNRPKVVVGFAAESEDLVDNARKKLEAKGLDLIVANDITAPDAGFASDTNQVTLIQANGDPEPLELMSKAAVAEILFDRIVGMLA
jgi:phosphopantothenoylcysteine decarboxylase/phosphopantothenate--cysteine ligase